MVAEKEIILQGVAASPSIAIGKVFLFEDYSFSIEQKEIPAKQIDSEIARFNAAIEKTRADFKEAYGKINEVLGKNYAKIASVHLVMLDDPMMHSNVTKKIKSGINAEYAIFSVFDEIIKSFDAIENEYFKERKHDIYDVGKKIIANLLGKHKTALTDISENSIVVAHNLTPADTVSMREKLVEGFATDIGGKTSHTAIVAQGLEIPAVVGLRNISSRVKTGDQIVIDGNLGIVILNPSDETLEKYRKEAKQQIKRKEELKKLRDLPAQTLDGHLVDIHANIDNPDEVRSILNNGATGIGLYRTEFMYFNRSDMPSAQEHFENYSKVVRAMTPHATIIRTIDLGGDKLTNLGLLHMDEEANPFMGLRAMRLCLKYPDIFIDQLNGILRASAFGKIRIMYPMISGIEELRAANKILESVKKDLRSKRIAFDEDIEVGTMIEIPSAAVAIDIIAKETDFVSIGTNDLIQYTLAVDRVNENVANLYDPLHPSIIRLIKMIIDGAHKAQIKAGMCGEMAGDPFYTPVLLGLGLDEFSVSAAQIPKIKKIVRSITFAQAKELADGILASSDRDKASKLISKIRFEQEK